MTEPTAADAYQAARASEDAYDAAVEAAYAARDVLAQPPTPTSKPSTSPLRNLPPLTEPTAAAAARDAVAANEAYEAAYAAYDAAIKAANSAYAALEALDVAAKESTPLELRQPASHVSC